MFKNKICKSKILILTVIMKNCNLMFENLTEFKNWNFVKLNLHSNIRSKNKTVHKKRFSLYSNKLKLKVFFKQKPNFSAYI